MWFIFALLSAIFAAITSILAKLGIEGANSNLATAIRTVVVLVMAWGMVFLTNTQGEIADISKKSWDAKMLEFCQTEQAKILEACAPMLKEDGMLLYSTCTFSPEENEKSIGDFLENHPEFELVEIPKENGFVSGLAPFEACARLYPHKLQGEGHFLALLRKKESDGTKPVPAEDGKWTKQMDAFADFA